MKYLVIFTTTAIIVLSLFSLAAINHDAQNIDSFEVRAQKYLGTDNFTIMSWDGYLIAQTPEGNQYPPEEMVDQYFADRLNVAQFTVVVGVVVLLVILVFSRRIKQ